MGRIRVSPQVTIDESELEVSFARSSGAGGQHVNTSATKVTLRWDVGSSPSLTAEQRERLRGRLSSRLTADGVLVLQSSEHRSQTRNREAAVRRLVAIVGEALRPQRRRVPTQPSRQSRRRRLEDKRRRSERKQLRRPPEW